MILAAYVNVGSLDECDVKKYCEKISKMINTTRGAVYYIIPVRDQETKIECVYPSLVSDKEIKEKLNTCLDDIINNIKNTLNEK